MRYAVGDKVYVKPELIRPAVPRMIDLYGGKICTIESVYKFGDRTKYVLLDDPFRYFWYSENFEPAEDSRFDDIDILLF